MSTIFPQNYNSQLLSDLFLSIPWFFGTEAKERRMLHRNVVFECGEEFIYFILNMQIVILIQGTSELEFTTDTFSAHVFDFFVLRWKSQEVLPMDFFSLSENEENEIFMQFEDEDIFDVARIHGPLFIDVGPRLEQLTELKMPCWVRESWRFLARENDRICIHYPATDHVLYPSFGKRDCVWHDLTPEQISHLEGQECFTSKKLRRDIEMPQCLSRLMIELVNQSGIGYSVENFIRLERLAR